MKPFSVILATTKTNGIGYQNRLPWPRLSQDMKRFKEITSTSSQGKLNAVIMGRKTWESLHGKPLFRRINYVVSSNRELRGAIRCESMENALTTASHNSKVDKIFVIGGAQLFDKAFQSEWCKEVYWTRVDGNFLCDTFVQPLDTSAFYLVDENESICENGTSYQFLKYIRSTNKEEKAYLSLIQKIMEEGVTKEDRTGVGTKSIFGNMMRYSLEGGVVPLLTTKQVYIKGVIKELLWMIRGDTDGAALLEDGVKIWYGNGTREFLDKAGLSHYQEHELGPIYGHQWRRFGAPYLDKKKEEVEAFVGPWWSLVKTKEVDQLQNVIDSIKSNPNSRRHIISSWNPCQISEMALPPCHVLAQFYVSNGELSCCVYQRSCDVMLGLPFNIASYAILTHMIAHLTGLKAKELIHTTGDTHIYLNHFQGATEQLTRAPYSFPTLNIIRPVENIDDFQYNDIQVVNYKHHPKIRMEMAC